MLTCAHNIGEHANTRLLKGSVTSEDGFGFGDIDEEGTPTAAPAPPPPVKVVRADVKASPAVPGGLGRQASTPLIVPLRRSVSFPTFVIPTFVFPLCFPSLPLLRVSEDLLRVLTGGAADDATGVALLPKHPKLAGAPSRTVSKHRGLPLQSVLPLQSSHGRSRTRKNRMRKHGEKMHLLK